MTTDIFLTSNGFFTEEIKECFMQSIALQKNTTAVIITTASKEKEQNRYARKAKSDLLEMGVNIVDFLDVEYDDPSLINNYSIIYINGGNPYKLLYHLKESGADKELVEFAAKKEGVIVGVSAGAMVLGPHIYMVDAFTPFMNEIELRDLSGLYLHKDVIFPHYDREDLFEADTTIEDRLREFESSYDCNVIRMKDKDFLLKKSLHN
ncbi:Type 1 glutamine amidotransferase-like domain-containing protein [Pontibacillus sp. HMF3514]|uniref:Type 1 glutamine amidotransferase-like domain-containing protein n=1 Tax=Pontibacillus sp. HMF3514 TaxID=2692425 RepID=UPI00131F9B64|nr:Type 1 glutamine amidotransferase-like domain-containing protein [Pontibacillus sp. HMF3514]QHE53940.1 type 1 glutamine amidotransferase-like domain-containing protein [Pontibacillus sp. HMF3514]